MNPFTDADYKFPIERYKQEKVMSEAKWVVANDPRRIVVCRQYTDNRGVDHSPVPDEALTAAVKRVIETGAQATVSPKCLCNTCVALRKELATLAEAEKK